MNQFPPDGYAERPRQSDNDHYNETPEGNLPRMGQLRFFLWTASIGLGFLIVFIVVGLIALASRSKNWDAIMLLWCLAQWLCLVPLCIRRAYDMDLPAWTGWIAPLPPVLLVWIITPGSRGLNRYGPPPVASRSTMTAMAWALGMVSAVIFLLWLG